MRGVVCTVEPNSLCTAINNGGDIVALLILYICL